MQIAGYDIQEEDRLDQWGIYIRKPRRTLNLIQNIETRTEAFKALRDMKELHQDNVVEFSDEDPLVNGFYMVHKGTTYIVELLEPNC
ncbi:hypothetical protein SEA_WEASELS2_233 [Rhodococcus phage Weasels2]|uniref:Uncharacterized protein n=1 Tax=Rhodococcus phage Weasels2 TaxID=1897437 RepID=A0A1I9SAK5_9CAUD|nr:hypothetical protein FDH04_gp183 [Rhodococcus phage Weasels2]AOZ63811.1 hypothetical protein SEA_WEASELS2_233 [Rhodococcus phage Weasels2]